MSATPQVPEPSVPQHRTMEHDKDLDQFNTAISAWLDDENAEAYPEDKVQYHAGSGFVATERAIVTARGHEGCSTDQDRAFDVVVSVTGADGIETVQTIPPGVGVGCVLGALNNDPEVVRIRILGAAPLDKVKPDPEPEPEIVVTSEMPGVAVSWDTDSPKPVYTYPRRWLFVLRTLIAVFWRRRKP